MGEGVTSIGANAFRNCSQFVRVEIPNGVTELPECCFDYCEKLQEVVLPEGLKKIGRSALSTVMNYSR